MSPPSRETSAGNTYLDLQARAKREGRPTDELFVLYVLERFLYRLSSSIHRDQLILKGGMLLAAFDERRPTRDVDLLARGVSNEVDAVGALVQDILAIRVDDGVVYATDRLAAQTIRGHDRYPGVRVVVPARIDRAEHPLRLDVNVGDPVTPAPVEILYPALLADPFPVVGYPIESVLAEKVVTMVDRGETTTRERDFADVVLLARREGIDAARLAAAITATATYRRSELRPLSEILVHLGSSRQPAWLRYLDRAGLRQDLPRRYEAAIAEVVEFVDPILSGEVSAGS